MSGVSIRTQASPAALVSRFRTLTLSPSRAWLTTSAESVGPLNMFSTGVVTTARAGGDIMSGGRFCFWTCDVAWPAPARAGERAVRKTTIRVLAMGDLLE